MLIGRPFVREFAAVDQPEEVVKSELFAHITMLLTWIWIAAFAGMTVSSAIPPIVYGDATILDTKTPLSFVCYWVIPFTLLGLAALASRVLPERMTPGDDDPPDVLRVVRRSGDRPTDPLAPNTRTVRRGRQGGLRRQDREQGNSALGGRDARVVAGDIQGPRASALVGGTSLQRRRRCAGARRESLRGMLGLGPRAPGGSGDRRRSAGSR
jgi:hypothetical protein